MTLKQKMIFGIIILAVLIIILVYLNLTRIKRKKQIERVGKEGEDKVSAVLEKFAKRTHSKLLNGAYLPLYDSTCEIDHLLFGKFGIAVIETKNISGKLSGSGKNLTHTVNGRSKPMYNPVMQNKTHVDNIKYHLQKAHMENTPVHSFVVFANDSLKADAGIGIYLNQLTPKLDKLPNAGCDTGSLYKYIDSIRVKSPLKKFLHKYHR